MRNRLKLISHRIKLELLRMELPIPKIRIKAISSRLRYSRASVVTGHFRIKERKQYTELGR